METLMTNRIAQAIAVSGCKIDRKRGFKQCLNFYLIIKKKEI